jgi:acyl-CoA thioesterase
MPEGVPGPGELAAAGAQAFPGAEVRPVPGEASLGGVPVEMAWHRFDRPLESQAANQAVLVWATCGNIIGLGMRPHRDTVHIGEAHSTLSTGVIAHTTHFVDTFDVSQWLLMATEATKAGSGRVFGGGRVFTEDGRLVAVFHQDSMAKAAEGPLDPKRSM